MTNCSIISTRMKTGGGIMKFCNAARLAAAFLFASGIANAQTFPTKPVRFITASLNSPQDLVGRIVGNKLNERWGQPVVIENRAGSGSLLSITTAAKAAPDGYSALVVSSAYAVTPYLFANPG